MKTIKSKSQPREELAESTRNNILEVATREFADKGLAGARIDEIAEKTESSKRMIYYYFGGKDGLYRAVLERAYAGIRKGDANKTFAGMDAEAALRALIDHTFDYHLKHPEFVRLVMNENILRGAHIKEVAAISERNKAAVEVVRAIVDQGVAEGRFRDDIDPLGLHLTMSALSFYCVSNRYTIRASFGLDTGTGAGSSLRRKQIMDTLIASVRR